MQRSRQWWAEYREKNREHLNNYSLNYYYKKNLKEKRKIWYGKNAETLRSSRREWHQKKRMEVIDLLGKVCSACGFSDWRALQIDHIDGGGCKERKSISHTPSALLFKVIESIKTNEYKYQLLCANCNWIKRYEAKEQFRKKI